MKGHEPLIQMRMSGKAPQAIYIEDHMSFNSNDWHRYNELPCINVAGDEITSIDLRFAVGLIVNISSFSEKRAKALFSIAKDAKARVVTSCVLIRNAPYWKQDGWSEIYIGK
jgi:hypothetical protein